MIERNKTKIVKVGDIYIGGSDIVYIQSMCNTKTSDARGTIKQIKQLEDVGCQLVRVSVPDIESAEAIEEIKNNIDIPLVADIHFDYKLALMSIERGIDKIRINPGNIGDETKIKSVVDACKSENIPIRIGVNSGSLSKRLLEKYDGHILAEALYESAKENIELLEKYDFYDTIVSIKSSNVMTMIDSYKLFAENYDYPLHLGLTEAGTVLTGSIKSSVGLGILLNQNIGNTIRVSLSSDPVDEIKVAKTILRALGLYKSGIELISCPTCARTKIDIIKISNEIENRISNINTKKHLKVAIMGCAVNGPGEASDADIGIAGGDKEALLFEKGKIIKKIDEGKLIDELMNRINELLKGDNNE